MTMHESHMLTPRPVFSPMEWGSLKLEQDRNKLEMSRRQQQQDLVLQQQRLQQQQQQMVSNRSG
jgi:chromatin modification-related protein VID21